MAAAKRASLGLPLGHKTVGFQGFVGFCACGVGQEAEHCRVGVHIAGHGCRLVLPHRAGNVLGGAGQSAGILEAP
eukprot:11030337-Ditylum_brightwellii.AAC.1